MGLGDAFDYLLLKLSGSFGDGRARERRPRARIREMRDGLVRVTGQVRSHGALLRAPVSGRPCVAFHVLVEERVPFQSQDSGWTVLLDLQDACPFSIVDDSDQATVDTSGPMELALEGLRGPMPRLDPANRAQLERVKRLLESRGFSLRTLFGFPRTFLYEETIVAEGEKISVDGLGIHEVTLDGQRGGPRDPVHVVLRGTEEEPLVISDPPSPGSGQAHPPID
jgi:hypothetical protein